MSRKYFEAIGRQRASLGLMRPYITLRAPQWAQDAANDGYDKQKGKSWRRMQKEFGCVADERRLSVG